MNTIYKLTSPSGKSYIGKTKRPLSKRIIDHKSDAKTRCRYCINKTIKKYGFENFDVEILYQGTHMINENSAEQYFIRYYNSKVPFGYNLTDGGEGGKGNKYWLNKSFTNAHKKKISDSIRGSKNPFYGRKHSEETKMKMRRTMSEETKKKLSEANKGRIPWNKGLKFKRDEGCST